MIVDSAAKDIVYSNYFTGIHGNYLKPSIANAGMDPDNLPEADPIQDGFRRGDVRRQGLEGHLGFRPGHRRGQEDRPGGELVDRLESEYKAARARLARWTRLELGAQSGYCPCVPHGGIPRNG
jgi:nitronate monooxygenase